MASLLFLKNDIESGGCDEQLSRVYGGDFKKQRERYLRVLDAYEAYYGTGGDISFFSAPGRTEVGGNHTDHNHGKVLAAAVNLDAVAAAAKNSQNIVRIKSEGHDMNVVDLADLNADVSENGRSTALVRGVCSAFAERGYKVGGFDAATTSNVLAGSGLSSSAAFEVLVGTMLNELYNESKVSAVEIAQIAQYAENKFFGKPCGLMDQTACSVGGFVAIDFNNPGKPKIKAVDFDFSRCGHSLCIINTGGDHSDLTEEYAAVRMEMNSVAQRLGHEVLREVDEGQFYNSIDLIRKVVGDRAVIRAVHFFNENARVDREVAALKKGDFELFKQLVIESGRSSYMYNQNVFVPGVPKNEPVALALCLCEQLLSGKGAWRVHGGGFAGTIQAFVPDDAIESFLDEMGQVFGRDNCYVLSIRPFGGIKVI